MLKTKPMLVTFDGEARSGKGTIVQATKDYLRDGCGLHTMLIDRGQTFRALVVASGRAGIDLDNPQSIDNYLENPTNISSCAQFVKDVYRMSKEERSDLLYNNEVGANSAKIGARASSQDFVRMLTKHWINDAGNEGFDAVLIDGRSLEKIAIEMDQEELCDYKLGLYFICNPVVGARRTLGYAKTAYDDLSASQRSEVDTLVQQILQRNQLDHDRAAEPLLRPRHAETYLLPNTPATMDSVDRPIFIIDTSAELTRSEMSLPVAQFVAAVLGK